MLECAGFATKAVMSFGSNVRIARQALGWSQEKLADKCGYSRNYISEIERGLAVNLSYSVRSRLVEILGIEDGDPDESSRLKRRVAFLESKLRSLSQHALEVVNDS